MQPFTRSMTAKAVEAAVRPSSVITRRLPSLLCSSPSMRQRRQFSNIHNNVEGADHLRWKRASVRSHINSLQSSRRRFSATTKVAHGHIEPPKPGEEINVTFVDKDGDRHTFQVSKGDNLLDIAQANDLEMEGACGGSCACSTCHVIVEDADMYDTIPEPDDDENDMLDLAFGLTETSRLGCQIHMTKELDGLVVKLPNMTRNLQASDFEKR